MIKESTSTNGFRFLLGDAATHDFHSGPDHQIWYGNTHVDVRSGETRINGAVRNGTTGPARPRCRWCRW